MLSITTKCGVMKSEFDFYVELFLACHSDVAGPNYPKQEWELDRREIANRVSAEGVSFLTKTLPRFGKAIDKALSHGSVLSIPGFEKRPGTQIPRFLGSLVEQVFRPDGCERSDASVWALSQLRQLCNLLYKLELPYTDDQEQKVLADFVSVDRTLADLDLSRLSGSVGRTLERMRLLAHRVFGNVDPSTIAPRHGPGAVSTGEKPWEKKTFKRYYTRLARAFPYDQFFFYNLSHLSDELLRFHYMPELESGQAKVCLVPKDSRGPRLISCEPLEYQWIQQGLGRLLMSTLESNRYTRGYVNFTHQSVNRSLALEGSLTQRWVTLDMKEASDRVSLELVWLAFRDLTPLMRALYSCRTSATRMPNGEIVTLEKFAPMGSALCFPVEAFIFWAISVAAIQVHRGETSFRSLPEVYVYGDDIICRREDHPVIVAALEAVGLKVNYDKSCISGFFRESCGCDAYKGVDVTPARIRKRWRPRVPESLASYSAYQQNFDKRGYYHVSVLLQELLLKCGLRYLDSEYSEAELRGITYGLQAVNDCPVALRLHSHVRPPDWEQYAPYKRRVRVADKSKPDYHRLEVRAPMLTPVERQCHKHGWREMLRLASVRSIEVVAGHYSIRRRVTLKRRWTGA